MNLQRPLNFPLNRARAIWATARKGGNQEKRHPRLKTYLLGFLCIVLSTGVLPHRSAAKEPFTATGLTRSATLSPTLRPEMFQAPIATFLQVRLEHHVRMRGQNGFVIHMNLRVLNRQNFKCRVAAYFYDAATNKEIPAAPGSPNFSTGGTAVIWRNVSPGYPTTYFNDFRIFVSTKTFQALPKGRHELKTILYVDSGDQLIGQSGAAEFTLTL
jgi:hypothetical protein